MIPYERNTKPWWILKLEIQEMQERALIETTNTRKGSEDRNHVTNIIIIIIIILKASPSLIIHYKIFSLVL